MKWGGLLIGCLCLGWVVHFDGWLDCVLFGLGVAALTVSGMAEEAETGRVALIREGWAELREAWDELKGEEL